MGPLSEGIRFILLDGFSDAHIDDEGIATAGDSKEEMMQSPGRVFFCPKSVPSFPLSCPPSNFVPPTLFLCK